jgi:guanidinopropionase
MRQQGFQPLDSAVIPRFAEPATFMRTPYVQSYAGLDIALVGVPFDLGSTNRASARHGPAQIREMSRLIRRVNASSAIAPFDICHVADVGHAPQNPLDLLDSLESREMLGVMPLLGSLPPQGPCLDTSA